MPHRCWLPSGSGSEAAAGPGPPCPAPLPGDGMDRPLLPQPRPAPLLPPASRPPSPGATDAEPLVASKLRFLCYSRSLPSFPGCGASGRTRSCWASGMPGSCARTCLGASCGQVLPNSQLPRNSLGRRGLDAELGQKHCQI